jgi:FkbM family methyltransferase
MSFDKAIIEEFGCDVYGFDPTPKSIKFIKNENPSIKFHFYQFGIGNQTGTYNFYLPKNSDHVSGSVVSNTNIEPSNYVEVELRSFNNIVNELGHKKIDVLKMDIEGSEFIVLDSLFEANVQIGQILIEFHDRIILDGKQKRKIAEKKLRAEGFEIFAVSDSLEEVSFINRRFLVK